jgi:hypothetical protein
MRPHGLPLNKCSCTFRHDSSFLSNQNIRRSSASADFESLRSSKLSVLEHWAIVDTLEPSLVVDNASLLAWVDDGLEPSVNTKSRQGSSVTLVEGDAPRNADRFGKETGLWHLVNCCSQRSHWVPNGCGCSRRQLHPRQHPDCMRSWPTGPTRGEQQYEADKDCGCQL